MTNETNKCEVIDCENPADLEVNDMRLCSFHEEDMRLESEAKFMLMQE